MIMMVLFSTIALLLWCPFIWSAWLALLLGGTTLTMCALWPTSLSMHVPVSEHLFSDVIVWPLLILALLVSWFMICTNASQVLAWPTSMNWLIVAMLMILALIFLVSQYAWFYVAFETSLIPISLMVLGWGYQPERLSAASALILYTIVASLPLLAIIFYFTNHSFHDMESVSHTAWAHRGSFLHAEILSVAALGGFLVKFPMFFLHLWLPKAHVEAPVVGSMILAALLLKLGGYGMWRILAFLPNTGSCMVLSAVAFAGGALVGILCLRQTDMKVLIAYSSVSHMSFAISCLLLNTSAGMKASLILMVTHGVSSSGMFSGANYIYNHSHSRNLLITGGLLNVFPALTMAWFLICLGNMGAPPTINLIGEIWAIVNLANLAYLFIPVFMLSSFFAVAYTLLIYAGPNQGQLNSLSKFLTKASMLTYLALLGHAFFLSFGLFLFL